MSAQEAALGGIDSRHAAADRAAVGYRADIDGLRCIAVVAVMLFHLNAPLVSGGFVGVDIFFVISGFLITKIIDETIDQSLGRFLLSFYERRVRRIIPALFVMLAIVSFIGYVVIIPYYYPHFAETAAMAAVSISNFFFWMHNGYFDPAGDFVPLLHTWSLGVEEQFYITFPLIFWVCRRRLGLSWPWIILPLFALSLFFGILQTGSTLKPTFLNIGPIRTDQSAAFFLPMSRCWEFLVGSVLAVGIISVRTTNNLLLNGLAGLGLGLVLLSLFWFSRNTLFPGVAALAPCLGAALIIYANTNSRTIVGDILSIRPLVWTGLISYSLYLWHWPIISFTHLLWGSELAFSTQAGLIAAMFGIAWLSVRYVERPVRRNRVVFKRWRVFAFAAVGVLAFVHIDRVVTRGLGLPNRFSAAARVIADGAWDRNPRTTECDNKPLADIATGRVCAIGAQDAPVTFAVLGDSIANSLVPGVEEAANRAGRRGFVLTQAGCDALLGLTSDPVCNNFIQAGIALVKRTPSIKSVILISRWSTVVEGQRFGAIAWNRLFITDAESKSPGYDENKAVFVRSMQRNAEAFAGYRLFIVAYVPEQTTSIPLAGAVREQFGLASTIGTPRAIVDRRQARTEKLLNRSAARFGFTVLDVRPALCDQLTCHGIADGRSLYSDDNHLSRFGAIRLAPVLARAFADP